MPGLKFEAQLTICIVVSILIFLPGCLTQGTDPCNDHNDTTACCNANCAFISCLGTDNSTVSKCINMTTANTVCLNYTADGNNNCTTEPVPCADIKNETECCASSLNCTYITNCTADNSTLSNVCVADTNASISEACPKGYGQKMCIDPVVTCANFSRNETECCASSLNCTFITNCTADGSTLSDVCVQDDKDAISTTCPKGNGTRTCPKDQPTTTPSPQTTTTPPAVVKCNTLNAGDCCGATGKSLSCFYVNCTGTLSCFNETEKANCNATLEMCNMLSSTTTLPTTTTTTASGRGSDCSKQHFDGASFIGGIILCGGIIAIIFFGLKFYRSRQDSNYHTL